MYFCKHFKLLNLIKRCKNTCNPYRTIDEQFSSVLCTLNGLALRLYTICVLIGVDLCESAISLTEYWRKVYNDSETDRSTCDTKSMINSGRPWFRFSGAAGSRMLNRCVVRKSCGTNIPMWSDDPMPIEIGEEFEITAKGIFSTLCDKYKRKVLVKKCSGRANDYTYKYTDTSTVCDLAFCGMD